MIWLIGGKAACSARNVTGFRFTQFPPGANPAPSPGETRDCLDPRFHPLIQPYGQVWPCCWFYSSLGMHETPFTLLINGPFSANCAVNR